MIKNIVRQHISLTLPDDEIKKWFEPLLITKSDKTSLSVQFPHEFFYRWFEKEKKYVFETFIKELFPNIHIKYICALSEEKKVFFPVDKKNENTIQESKTPYTLDNFIFNKKNDFPLAVVKKSLQAPFSELHSPLIFYGKSGSGKTHILYAMADALQYTINTVFLGTPSDFRKISTQKKEQICAFFIDDTQQLRNNNAAQQDFLELFTEKQHKNVFIVFTLDDHPLSCEWLIEKLRMRLSKGLAVELKVPDLDIRHRYVRRKNTQLQLKISKENLLLIAQNFHDIRLIDGALNKIRAYSTLLGKKSNDIMEIIGSNKPTTPLNHLLIIQKVAEYYSLQSEDIIGKNRGQLVTTARQVAMYLCRELLGISLVQIGTIFSGRDHSAVLYAINKIKQIKDTNKDMNISISKLKEMFLFSSL